MINIINKMPRVQMNQDGTFTLLEDVSVEIMGIIITAPTGMPCDGASIPSILHSVIGPPVAGPHLLAAIIHDSLCILSNCYADRVFADGVFFHLLTDADIPRWKRTCMYVGVRTFARLKYSPIGRFMKW